MEYALSSEQNRSPMSAENQTPNAGTPAPADQKPTAETCDLRSLGASTGSVIPLPPVRSCPTCHRTFGSAEGSYLCELCGGECCTACSDTTARHAVVCDVCLETYDDGWTQGRGDSSPNTKIRDGEDRRSHSA